MSQVNIKKDEICFKFNIRRPFGAELVFTQLIGCKGRNCFQLHELTIFVNTVRVRFVLLANMALNFFLFYLALRIYFLHPGEVIAHIVRHSFKVFGFVISTTKVAQPLLNALGIRRLKSRFSHL